VAANPARRKIILSRITGEPGRMGGDEMVASVKVEYDSSLCYGSFQCSVNL
jgi:hypothetical protein